MANPTFNAGIDYFGLDASSNGALKVTTSDENRSKQSTSSPNLYGDAAVVDSWGETAAPSAEYTVVSALTQTTFPDLGSVRTVEGIENPVVLGGVSISTKSGSAPTVSLTSSATALGATISSPVAKSCPEGGYTQYTWTVSFPLTGEEVASGS